MPMLNKMPGYFPDKFANLKAGYTYMMGHPGKKLLFMGQDFGQLHEWDEKVSLDWYLTEEELHSDLSSTMSVICFIFTRNILHSMSLMMTGTVSSGSMPTTGIGVFSALSATQKTSGKACSCLQLYAHGET